MYEGVYVEVISTDKFDEDTDISTIYLGQVDMKRNTEVKAGENFPMTARGYPRDQLLDSTDCDILIVTVIRVQIIFPAMQVAACNAKIHF